MATDTERLRRLIDAAEVVIWDFDGPICRLFAGYPAGQVAADLIAWLERGGRGGLPAAAGPDRDDPHAVLRAVGRRQSAPGLVAELEERLTQDELRAAVSAWPTPYADPLIRTWTAVGARPAVATNNSPRAVKRYLESRGLLGCFGPHIYGRTRELGSLKPAPDTLLRALRARDVDPSAALFIGDAATDHEAARQAGVPFLGYARDERKRELLRDAGAEAVVDSLEPLLRLVRGT
ncbi:HAD family hydrolase [Streptomyces sp. CRN 30]|uniref:HAD family hydrolase n=1 Tax=Streptomyces sp. CRN 30 TaxID=3075613 RepID=UPI002A81B401|nr:HAD family hydrolase [Streptomyces sp. CRN 30]